MKVEVTTIAGTEVLLMSPDRDYVLDRGRLEHLRDSITPSRRDWAALEAVRAHPEIRAMVFLGKSEQGSWGFAPDLSDEEVEELGRLMVFHQLETWREMALRGLVSMLHVELGMREALALEAGREQVRGEAEDPLDVWVLGRMCAFMHSPLADASRDVMPSVFRLLERRAEQVASLRMRSAHGS